MTYLRSELPLIIYLFISDKKRCIDVTYLNLIECFFLS